MAKNTSFAIMFFLSFCSLFAQQYVPDSSFGSNGVKTTDHQIRPVSGDFYDGKYLFFGNNNRFARYNYNGDVDYNFGNYGFSVIAIENKYVYLKNFKLHEGKIYAFGYVQDVSNNQLVDAVLIRLNTNGLPDTDFGTNGIATVDLGVHEFFRDILINPDGSIFAIGNKEQPGEGLTKNTLLCKFLSNGVPDTSFNATGYKIFFYGSASKGISISSYENGLLLGNWMSSVDGSYSDVVLQKIDANGNAMPDFGTNGMRRFSVDVYGSASTENFYSLKVIGDKVFCSFYFGLSFVNQGYRLQSYSLSSPYTKLADIYIYADSYFKIQPSGKILVTRGVQCASPSCYSTSFKISRYNANGTPDTSFNNTGEFIYDISPSQFWVEGATFCYEHQDGRILLAGVNPLCCSENALAMVRIGDIALSSNEFSSEPFALFPNPGKDILYLQARDMRQIEVVTVIDALGKAVISVSGTVGQLDVSKLQTGIYVVSITSEGKDYKVKFVKS